MAGPFGMRIRSTFSPRPVMSAMDRATRRVLSRFGAFVRQTARRSIRKRKRSARAGQPPSSHVGTLKRLIFFAYDRGRESVVVGPTRARKGQARTLEEGGMTRRRQGGRLQILRYQPHPYMKPALDNERPKLPQMWRNAVKR